MERFTNFVKTKNGSMIADIFERDINETLLLRHHRVDFSEAERHILATLWVNVSSSKGEVIPGDDTEGYYYLARGLVRVGARFDGKEHTLCFADRGDMLATNAFPSRKGLDVFIIAERASELWRIGYREMEIVCSKIPLLNLFFLRVQQRMIQKLVAREIYLSVSSPVKRYATMLAQEIDRLDGVPQKHIASYLNMTPQTLSKIIADQKRSTTEIS